ncbi:MAG: flagellar FlbD family protein [Planctomycetota bacterium]|jgi:flagellar protein FlbD
MITVTRLDERVVVINAELIKMIESTPDTIITLINGDTLIVRENVDEVVRRAIDYARQIRGFQVV